MDAIDRSRVRSSFDAQAGLYDRHAVVQKRILERFVRLLPREDSVSRILDIGSGTGRLLQRLSGRYPEAMLVGLDLAFGMGIAASERLSGNEQVSLITADAETLPFSDSSFDIVLSTSTFQWLETFERAFAEIRRVLKPGARFSFALFGEKTLYELRLSYQAAVLAVGGGAMDRTHQFKAVDDVGVALRMVGLEPEYLASEFEVETHPDVLHLLRSIRKIGAGNAVKAKGRGLAERRVMVEMIERYQKDFGAQGTIPATYEVIYGQALNPFSR